MGNLAEVHPVAVARTHLLEDTDLAFALGVPQDQVAEHVTDRNEPPYPHVKLTDPPGDDRDMRHLIAPLLQIEVHGDLDGSQSRGVLRAVLYTVLQSLQRLPETEAQAGDPVVTAVTSTGGGGYSPEPTDQPRYLATVRMYMHPAQT